MTHERLLELVGQVNGALTGVSWPFIIYEALSKSSAAPDLKTKLDLRRGQILSSIVLEIEETLRPFWPRSASRIIVEPEYNEEASRVLSDGAMDALRGCLVENESLSVQASKIRTLAGKVLRWDSVCYWLTFSTAVLALAGLAVWFLYDGMTDRIAKLAIVIPALPAILALAAAATRQVYMQEASNAIVKEEE
jgi:hypothetical protein